MNKIKENLGYILSDEDSDKVKFEKIYRKMNENKVNLDFTNIEIQSHNENYILGFIDFCMQDEEFKIPFISDTQKFNSDLHSIILDFKKIIIFEKLNILPSSTKVQEITSSGNATDKQKSLLKDKMTHQESKEIIESKLKEFGLSSIDEISKDQASKIIDNLPKRRQNG